jgi:hypothetical protein
MFAHEDILSAFDDLVARNIVLYGPETVVNLVDDDFQVSTSQPFCGSSQRALLLRPRSLNFTSAQR